MPTAAKLLAALGFAAVAFLAAELFKPGMPPDTVFGLFSVICAGFGLVLGWTVMGRLTGRGYAAAAGYGLRTSVTIVFWVLLVFSVREMLLRSVRRQYDGVMGALEGVFDLMIVHGQALLRPEPLIALVAGGILAGWLAEWGNRQWR